MKIKGVEIMIATQKLTARNKPAFNEVARIQDGETFLNRLTVEGLVLVCDGEFSSLRGD
jgi:hypothetical protein